MNDRMDSADGGGGGGRDSPRRADSHRAKMKQRSKLCCCHVMNGAALVGTMQAVLIVVMLASSGLIIDRYRTWEQWYNSPDRTTVAPITTTPAVPVVPYQYDFTDDEVVEPGWAVVVYGTTNADAASFSIDLQCGTGGDAASIPLHVNPRLAETAESPPHVARNTKQDGAWDVNEEQGGGQPFLALAAFGVRIECWPDYYAIYISVSGGSLDPFVTYQHRIDYDCIGSAKVYGDITLTSVTYTWTTSSALAGSAAETWLEFTLAHNIAFCCVWLLSLGVFALSFYMWEPVMILPNLAMTVLGILATLVLAVTIIIRLCDPSPSRFETDGFEEAVLVYAVTLLLIWWLVNFIFIFVIYKYYKWMKGTDQVVVVEKREVVDDRYYDDKQDNYRGN